MFHTHTNVNWKCCFIPNIDQINMLAKLLFFEPDILFKTKYLNQLLCVLLALNTFVIYDWEAMDISTSLLCAIAPRKAGGNAQNEDANRQFEHLVLLMLS